MKRLIRFFMLVLLLTGSPFRAQAQVDFESDRNREIQQIKVTGFTDYQPFGFVVDPFYPDTFESIFKPIIDNYAKMANFYITYVVDRNYNKRIHSSKDGSIDVILGIYSDTDMYAGIDLVYPALINNPIVVIMTNNRLNEVKNIDDLKKLKGAVSSKEYLSDYVARQLKNFNLQTVDDDYELFKKLFTKEIDYIFASQYNGRVKIAKFGLKGQLGMSKSAIWNMPLFIGVSKSSVFYPKIRNGLTRMAADPRSEQIVRQALVDYITKIEKENEGVTAPDFIND